MDPLINKLATYFLRTPDGTVYGPVDVVTLCIWATDARVIPGCELSEKQDVWFPVEKMQELRLNWMVQFEDGTIYGPLNLLAIRILALEKSIPHGVGLREKGTDRKAVLDDSIMSLMEEELRRMLLGCGTLMSATIAEISRTHREAVTEAEDRTAREETLQAKLEKTENDLVTSVMLTSDLKAKCMAAERAAALEHEKRAEKGEKVARLLEENALLVNRVGEAQDIVKTKETQIQQLESAVADSRAQAEVQMAALRGKVSSLEKELMEAQQRAGLLAAELVQTHEEAQKVLTAQRAELTKESQSALHKKESLIKQLESAMADHKTHAEARLAEMLAKQGILEKELQETQRRTGVLSAQLVKTQESYQALLKESSRKEAENSEKLKRIEKEIKDSTELVTKTMRDMEQRESQLRDLQKRMDRKASGVSSSGAVVEVEVIHSEILPAESHGPTNAGDWISATEDPAPSPKQGEPVPKSGLLSSVEARLQKELRHWEVLKQEKENQKKSSPKWF